MISRKIARQTAMWFSPVSRPIILRPYHLSSALQQSSQSTTTQPRSPYIPAPTEASGPLLSRRADRDLPSLKKSYLWLKTLPLFVALITVSSLAIFNYQKSSSSTVNSILYALRTNDASREILGDEIYFASKVPWISGELNQLHGRIDISFWVKGNKGKGKVNFVSVRKRRDGYVSDSNGDLGKMLTYPSVRDLGLESADRRRQSTSFAREQCCWRSISEDKEQLIASYWSAGAWKVKLAGSVESTVRRNATNNAAFRNLAL
jgi:cytochrome c oxidase assembly factor 1